MHLVLFACPGNPSQSVRDNYQHALAAMGEVELVWLTARGLSSTFTKMARRLRGNKRRLLPTLIEAHAGRRETRSVTLLSYSAGYGFARELLATPADRDALSGYIALDSIHADLDADNTAADAQLDGFVAFAKRAKTGAAICWIGHSDVTTRGYASTTQTAQEIERLAGGQAGGFMVTAYDQHAAQHAGAEHRAALEAWGPGFVAEAMVPFGRLRC